MSMRHKHLAEWTAAHAPRRHLRTAAADRGPLGPRTFGMFAAAARLVERATRRNGL